MSELSSSPPSLVTDNEASRDTTSSELSTTANSRCLTSDISHKNDCRLSGITSHGVEDILSEGVHYNINDTVFTDCKPETESSISNAFVQDYNSRDSTGFTIHDILGLQQSFNPTHCQDDLEPRYLYDIPNYENISNNSNNYGSGAKEVIAKDCTDKHDNIHNSSTIHGNHIIYTNNFSSNDLTRYQDKSILGSEVIKETVRELNNLQDTSFTSQVRAEEI